MRIELQLLMTGGAKIERVAAVIPASNAGRGKQDPLRPVEQLVNHNYPFSVDRYGLSLNTGQMVAGAGVVNHPCFLGFLNE